MKESLSGTKWKTHEMAAAVYKPFSMTLKTLENLGHFTRSCWKVLCSTKKQITLLKIFKDFFFWVSFLKGLSRNQGNNIPSGLNCGMNKWNNMYVFIKPHFHRQEMTQGQFLSRFEFWVFLFLDQLPYQS